jgi:hypothetical protein
MEKKTMSSNPSRFVGSDEDNPENYPDWDSSEHNPKNYSDWAPEEHPMSYLFKREGKNTERQLLKRLQWFKAQ